MKKRTKLSASALQLHAQCVLEWATNLMRNGERVAIGVKDDDGLWVCFFEAFYGFEDDGIEDSYSISGNAVGVLHALMDLTALYARVDEWSDVGRSLENSEVELAVIKLGKQAEREVE